MDDPKLVADAIRSLIEGAPQKSLLGSDLALLLRQKHPTFRSTEHGCRNLREFIRHNVPSVYEAGRRGLDVTYAPSPVASAEPPTARTPSPTNEPQPAKEPTELQVDSEVWKTFVSPHSRYRLYVNRDSLSARVVDAHGVAPGPPWVAVPPCPVTKHLEIARQFIHTLQDASHRGKLEGVLANEVWWVPFFSLARALDLGKAWAAFRSKRLLVELQYTLDGLGVVVPPGSRLGLENRPAALQPAAATRRRRADGLLRRLAQGAISRMSEDELRALRIPLGDIVDQLGEDW